MTDFTIEYNIPETGNQELDERIDGLISESNDLYFKLSDRGLTDADMVLLRGTTINDLNDSVVDDAIDYTVDYEETYEHCVKYGED